MAKSSPKTLTRPEPKVSKPPRTLGQAGANLWARISEEYDLSDAGGRELLCLICEALDRVQSLRQQIDKEGEYVSDAKGNRRDNALLATSWQAAVLSARASKNWASPLRCRREALVDHLVRA